MDEGMHVTVGYDAAETRIMRDCNGPRYNEWLRTRIPEPRRGGFPAKALPAEGSATYRVDIITAGGIPPTHRPT